MPGEVLIARTLRCTQLDSGHILRAQRGFNHAAGMMWACAGEWEMAAGRVCVKH